MAWRAVKPKPNSMNQCTNVIALLVIFFYSANCSFEVCTEESSKHSNDVTPSRNYYGAVYFSV
jgi:hypothetical protein